MTVHMNGRYTPAQRVIVETALKAANEALARIYDASPKDADPKYHVSHIELACARRQGDELVSDPNHFLGADVV